MQISKNLYKNLYGETWCSAQWATVRSGKLSNVGDAHVVYTLGCWGDWQNGGEDLFNGSAREYPPTQGYRV